MTARRDDLVARLARGGLRFETLDEHDSTALWRGLRDAAPVAAKVGQIWRISVAPSEGFAVVERIRRAGAPVLAHFYDWAGGLIWLRLETAPDALCRRRAQRGGRQRRPCDAHPRERGDARDGRRLPSATGGACGADAPRQGKLRSGACFGARPHARGVLRDDADVLLAAGARRSRHGGDGEDFARLRALRILHGDMSDLSSHRRRTRRPARPHLSHQGDVREGAPG